MSQLFLIQSFVEDLLALKSLTDGGNPISKEMFEPGKVIQTVLNIFTPQANAAHIDLKFQAQHPVVKPETMYPTRLEASEHMHNLSPRLLSQSSRALPAQLIGYKVRLQQALINLIKNALKFSKPYGTISIRAGFDTDKLIFNVVDSGVGIAKDDYEKLFTRFGKLQRTAEINSEGLGLGLTIVKKIVEQSDGLVGVHS